MAEYVRPFQGKLITSIEGMVRKEFKSDTKWLTSSFLATRLSMGYKCLWQRTPHLRML
jgi:hypothetical protein